ncbi:GreA/GreB family elongation factor [Labrys monachus]|uniref:Transcription elongation GreA/GreB family factor n=1 Tax=Labrys monachus TaxID=217067 RepID=A0ABU0FK70_9HYPH|nr:GreA/GreB family elongation factor [Labrys monachus]MDQ0394514.1 transcription elongation GreA/GreB family factor [Labrys monachus]
MSRAFTQDGQEGEGAGVLPERPVSAERNLVTGRGLALIEAELRHFRAAFASAEAAADRTAMGNAARDIRYWAARRATAERVAAIGSNAGIRFGMAVTLQYGDGRKVVWRIVGEDEADAAAGRISHASPLARALYGKDIGEEVRLGPQKAEIVAIDTSEEDAGASGAALME